MANLTDCTFDGNTATKGTDIWNDGTTHETGGGDIPVPTLVGEGTFVDLTSSDTVVTVMPGNLKAGCRYGLGHAGTPAGPYVVDEGGWMQAGPDAKLPNPLTAPKIGASTFYRVMGKRHKGECSE